MGVCLALVVLPSSPCPKPMAPPGCVWGRAACRELGQAAALLSLEVSARSSWVSQGVAAPVLACWVLAAQPSPAGCLALKALGPLWRGAG